MTILVSRKAALWAVIASLPILAVALYFSARAFFHMSGGYEIIDFWIASVIFLLGSPLTLVYELSMPYIGQFLEWSIGNQLSFVVVPIYVLLFLTQWVIWSQLIVLAWRRLRRIKFDQYP
jgi:hypothetical protein